MTRVRIDLQVPGPAGLSGAVGDMTWRPTARHAIGDTVVLPAPFKVWLAGSPVEVDVEATGSGWAWEVLEPRGGGRRTVAVPASADPVDYADLVVLDPASLTPAPEDLASALDRAVTAAEEAAVHNLVVGPTNTLQSPGLWIETGLGPAGADFTLWIEDGQP